MENVSLVMGGCGICPVMDAREAIDKDKSPLFHRQMGPASDEDNDVAPARTMPRRKWLSLAYMNLWAEKGEGKKHEYVDDTWQFIEILDTG